MTSEDNVRIVSLFSMFRRSFLSLALVLTLLAFIACGGGGSTIGGNPGGSGDGSGGSNGPPPPTISEVSPYSVMLGIPLGTLSVYGSDFTNDAAVLIDGQPQSTTVRSSTDLEFGVDISFTSVIKTHQISVRQSSGTSNHLPLRIYEPQPGPEVMRATPGFHVANETDPTWIAVADIDEDGLDDVIMPGITADGSAVTVLKGRTDGSLALPTPLPLASGQDALAVGDLDGDGLLDLVSIVEDSGKETVSVYRGDGHGDFQPLGTSQTLDGIYAQFAQLADIDGDGKLDLLLSAQTTAGAGFIGWLSNRGGGNFAPAVILATLTGNYRYYAVADLNLDGKPDIVYTTKAPNNTPTVHTMENQGGGLFVDVSANGLNSIGGVVHMIDFNLDGTPDLVVQQVRSGVTHLCAFQGNGDGTFQQASDQVVPGVFSLVVGDFDHDGFPDLAGTDGSKTEPSYTMYFFGDGRGNFTLQQAVGPQGGYIATGDINGDGIPDVITPDRANFVSVALGRKDRNFPSALSLTPIAAVGTSVGDIDGDGLPEILGVGGSIYQNLGSGSFQLAGNTELNSIMLADLTGKGVADLLSVNRNYELTIWPNDGSFGFASSTPIQVPGTVNLPLAVADIDGDGILDIICSGEILYGTGSYQYAVVPMVGLGNPYAVADFDGDGRLDIQSGLYTFLNIGGRRFAEVRTELPIDDNGSLVTSGDFDGDGKLDMANTLPGSPWIIVSYGRGNGTFFQGAILDPGQYVGGLAAADFDHDGRGDIAVGLMISQQAGIFFSRDDGEFSPSFFASGAFTLAMTAADLNHSGNTDLIFTNFFLDAYPPNMDIVFHK